MAQVVPTRRYIVQFELEGVWFNHNNVGFRTLRRARQIAECYSSTPARILDTWKD